MADIFERSHIVHEQLHGKLATVSKMHLYTHDDLSIAYTPGVARPCEVIAKDPDQAWNLTIKRNTVAVVSDGSAVLGLGNIGPMASLPVMEGKAILFKEFADIDAFPICLDTQDTEEIITAVRTIAPVFGGVNLEDISAPRCFEIEDRLQDLDIPVFHDDQHGTAIVLLAALINASRVTGRPLVDMRVVINGAGAAGSAIATLLGQSDDEAGTPVGEIIICDSKGAISRDRTDLNPEKQKLVERTNPNHLSGSMKDVLKGADVFIGVSKGDILDRNDVQTMAESAIILAMANPIPEIMPDEAVAGGAVIVGTGRSDFPNQVNNVLCFPGIFRGALDAHATVISPEMKTAAALALAEAVREPTADRILPDAMDRTVAPIVARAVQSAAKTTGKCKNLR